jgi:hypothetical protein
MRLVIEYADVNGTEHRLERIFHLPVMGEDQQVTPFHTPSDSEAFARLEAPGGRDLAALRRNMVESFSRDDLYQIVFYLGLRADNFDKRISTMAREMITYAVQAGRLDELIKLCQDRRPRVEW